MQNIKTHNSLRKKLYIFRTIYNFTHGITMNDLAKELSLSSSQSYYHIESGRKKTITQQQLGKLAKLYNVSIDFLLDEKREVNIESIYKKSETIKIKDDVCSEKIVSLLQNMDLISKENKLLIESLVTLILKFEKISNDIKPKIKKINFS